MKNIIVVNEMHSDNIGDQAISDAMDLFCQAYGLYNPL